MPTAPDDYWSSRLPYVATTETIIPTDLLWAPTGDQNLRVIAWVNAKAQEIGRIPNRTELTQWLAPVTNVPWRRQINADSVLRTIERLDLDIITTGLAGSSADVYALRPTAA